MSRAADPFNRGYYNSEQLREFGFASVGENVQVAMNCLIAGAENISFASNVRVDAFTTLIATRGTIRIGSYVHVGGYCHLSAADDLRMDDFSGLSQGVRIYTASDDYSGRTMTNPTVPAKYTGAKTAPVNLGRHVIVGSGAIVLPGAEIGEGCAVGALSLVTKSLQPWGIYSGIPARRMKDRRRDLLTLEQDFLNRQAGSLA